MNLYVVVEGRRSEKRIYGTWLPLLFPGHARIEDPESAAGSHFYLVSGGGYPNYKRIISQAVLDIARMVPRYQHLMVCVDAEDATVDERRAELEPCLKGCPIGATVIVQDCCIETWLLGNRRLVPEVPKSTNFSAFKAHFDVRSSDPERMAAPAEHAGSRAAWHAAYLRAAVADRDLSTTKKHPGEAGGPAALDQLQRRVSETGHLRSLARLLALPDALLGAR